MKRKRNGERKSEVQVFGYLLLPFVKACATTGAANEIITEKREIKGEKGINETHNQNSVVLCGMLNSDIKVREEMR